MSDTTSSLNHYDAIVVGAGVAGLYQLHTLRESGYRVRLLEAGGGIGGTWYWNRYPGCRFDSESYTYQYNFSRELLDEWNWTEHFSPQPETLRYLNFAAEKFDWHKDIQLNARVKSAIFDQADYRWDLETETGERFNCQFLIMATGILSATQMPNIEGMDSFKGMSFHTSRWPHDPNGLGADTSVYEGKRVAVIGTGATGVQLIPHVAEGAKQLYVMQRTANWASPLFNARITDAEQPALKARYPEIFAACDKSTGAFLHVVDERSIFDVTEAEREARFEELYQQPGFAIWLSNFRDIMTDMRANDLISEFMARKIRARLKDPAVADKLVPSDHGFGQRRVPMETNYYETYNRDNVELIDLRETPIECITPKGVKTIDREYEVDLIVYATGFDAGTGAMRRIDIRGLDGLTIQDKWARGLRTNMSVQIAGFPNMFTHDGPHAAFCNIPRCAQVTVDWVTDLISHMREKGYQSVVTSEAAEQSWTEHATEQANKTLLSKTRSWIMGDNIEGKPRDLLLYSGPAPLFRQKLADCAANNYKGFIFQ